MQSLSIVAALLVLHWELVLHCEPVTAAAAAERPNIVLIYADELG
jgi:hypothetical protein